MASDVFREAARQRRTLFGAWLMVNCPLLVEVIGEAGWDAVMIDQQHGLGGHEDMVRCLTAARASGLAALVRVANNEPGLIGRVLDAGAQGIVCPLINSAEDADRLVTAVKYPPRGTRSWGPYRAQLGSSGEYVGGANAWTIACPQIETRGALDELDEILAIDGVDMVCFGPNDLSAALIGRFDIEAPEIKEAIDLVLRKCRENEVMAFIFANNLDYARPLVDAGWVMVAAGTDLGWFSAAAGDVIRQLKSGR